MKQVHLLLCVLLLAYVSVTQAQSGVTVEFGHNGEIVANRWNPVRVTLRDQEGAELILRLSQGGLRNEEKVVTYRADLPGGSGVHVFMDDLYVPAWNSFSWSVVRSGRSLESGSLDARLRLNGEKVHLIVSSNPGRWREAYAPEARLSEIPAGLLPERVAAYDGVASLLIDGTAAAPRLEAVAAATAAGVTTLIVTPLPSSHSELLALAAHPGQRLGVGILQRVSADEVGRALAAAQALDQTQLVRSLKTRDLIAYPARLPQFTLLIAASLYVLLSVLLVRFGGLPGLVSSLAVSLLFSVAAWQVLRPQASHFVRSRSLHIGGGDLATRLELQTVLSLPQREARSSSAARPLESRSYDVTPDSLTFAMTRWSVLDLSLRPSLQVASLRWRGADLYNAGESLLQDVYVKGLGAQKNLPADSSLRPEVGQDVSQVLVYEQLLPQLPAGTALARSGGDFFVALPTLNPEERLSWQP